MPGSRIWNLSIGQTKLLGIEVAHSKECIFISQQEYTVDLLQETSMTKCKFSKHTDWSKY